MLRGQEGTLIRIQRESFLLFSFYFRLFFLPTSTETLQLYAQFLSRYLKPIQPICNYISGVKTIHLLLSFPIEHINTFILNPSLEGIDPLNPHRIRQAVSMTPAILLKITSALDISSPLDSVYLCLFLFAFILLLSCQPRVTVTLCFVYKVIRDLESMDHLCINPSRRVGLIHK